MNAIYRKIAADYKNLCMTGGIIITLVGVVLAALGLSHIKDGLGVADILFIILGIAVFALGIFNIVYFTTGRYKKDMQESLKKRGVPEYEVASELLVSSEFAMGRMYISETYVVTVGLKPDIVPREDIVWFYYRQANSRRKIYNLIPVGGFYTCNVYIYDKNHNKTVLETRNEMEAKTVVKALAEELPYAIEGINSEIERLERREFDKIVKMSDDKRNAALADAEDDDDKYILKKPVFSKEFPSSAVVAPVSEPEPKPESIPAAPVAEPIPEQEPKSELIPAAPVAQPISAAEPIPEPEPKPEPILAAPVAEPIPEPKPEPIPATPVAEPMPEPKSGPIPVAVEEPVKKEISLLGPIPEKKTAFEDNTVAASDAAAAPIKKEISLLGAAPEVLPAQINTFAEEPAFAEEKIEEPKSEPEFFFTEEKQEEEKQEEEKQEEEKIEEPKPEPEFFFTEEKQEEEKQEEEKQEEEKQEEEKQEEEKQEEPKAEPEIFFTEEKQEEEKKEEKREEPETEFFFEEEAKPAEEPAAEKAPEEITLAEEPAAEKASEEITLAEEPAAEKAPEEITLEEEPVAEIAPAAEEPAAEKAPEEIAPVVEPVEAVPAVEKHEEKKLTKAEKAAKNKERVRDQLKKLEEANKFKELDITSSSIDEKDPNQSAEAKAFSRLKEATLKRTNQKVEEVLSEEAQKKVDDELKKLAGSNVFTNLDIDNPDAPAEQIKVQENKALVHVKEEKRSMPAPVIVDEEYADQAAYEKQKAEIEAKIASEFDLSAAADTAPEAVSMMNLNFGQLNYKYKEKVEETDVTYADQEAYEKQMAEIAAKMQSGFDLDLDGLSMGEEEEKRRIGDDDSKEEKDGDMPKKPKEISLIEHSVDSGILLIDSNDFLAEVTDDDVNPYQQETYESLPAMNSYGMGGTKNEDPNHREVYLISHDGPQGDKKKEDKEAEAKKAKKSLDDTDASSEYNSAIFDITDDDEDDDDDGDGRKKLEPKYKPKSEMLMTSVERRAMEEYKKKTNVVEGDALFDDMEI